MHCTIKFITYNLKAFYKKLNEVYYKFLEQQVYIGSTFTVANA